MRRILCYSFVIMIFSCCSEKRIDKVDYSNVFDKIDVSIYDGETNFYSLKILNSGKTYICINKHREPDIFYTFNMGDKELDSISFLVNKIFQTKIDTLYKEDCADCGCYRIIINSKNIVFESKVENINNSIVCLKNMNQLIIYLMQISDTSKKSLDSVFKFESKTREFYPALMIER